jgi:hypothetical protein
VPVEGIGTRIVDAGAEHGIDSALTELRGLMRDIRDHPALEPLDDAPDWEPVLERAITDLEAIRLKFYPSEPVADLISD